MKLSAHVQLAYRHAVRCRFQLRLVLALTQLGLGL